MSKIQWCDETWNPIVGCSKISPGCKNCYAGEAAQQPRLQQFPQYRQVKDWDGTVEFVESQLLKPLMWRSPKKIFVCSMSDIFHENVPDQWRDRAFAVMALAQQHTFQLLTKRPERMLEYCSELNLLRLKRALPNNIEYSRLDFIKLPLRNLWLGVSVENQKAALYRIPLLLQTPAAMRFLSCEPLLEQLDLTEWLGEFIGEGICDACDEIGILYAVDASPLAGGAICTKCCPVPDWVICGGESGSKARPCHLDWMLKLVNQCQLAQVPVFVKQLGSNPNDLKLKDRKGGNIDEFPEELKVREFPA